MKIGFVLDDSLDSTDGVQQYVLSLGRWLRANGHDVHYLVGRTKRTDITNIHSLGRNIAVRFNQNRLSIPLPVSRRRIAALLRQQRFDVLHVQMPYSPWLAGRIVQKAPSGTAVIGTFHILPYGRLASIGSRLLAWWLRGSLQRFDRVFCVSPAARDFARRVFKLQPDVVPNVIDTKAFRSNNKRLKRDGRLTIVFLGRLVPRKGCQELLKALEILRSEYPSTRWRALIGGGGPLEQQLKKDCRRAGLADVVEFLGFVDEADKPGLLRSADIAVFPSLGGESFGIVLIEAMAAGTGVVIGGDNPGYRSVLREWPACLLDPTDSRQFAAALHRLLTDEALRSRLHHAQHQAVDQYDVARVGTQLLKAYNLAIAKKPKT